MPLYECSKCHAVENTALTNFWMDHTCNRPALCSECDPEIGAWHGVFPKTTAAEYAAKFPGSKIEYPYPSIERKIVELRQAGWTGSGTKWRAPSGSLFLGPNGAYEAMVQGAK